MMLIDHIRRNERKYVGYKIREDEIIFLLAMREKIERKPPRGRNRRIEIIIVKILLGLWSQNI